MTTLPEIAAEARRMAAEYRSKSAQQTWQRGTGQSLCFAAAADFDRLAEMADRAAAGRGGYLYPNQTDGPGVVSVDKWDPP